jgi:Flp pilus assembly protein TadG
MIVTNQHRHDSNSGAALVEAAVTLMMFFAILIGLMEAGRFISFQQTLTDASREGARLAITPLSGTSTLPSNSQIKAQVQTFLDSNHVTGATITIDNPVVINTGGINTQFTRVTVQAPYSLITLSMFSSLAVTLEGRSLMRNETSP